MEYRLTTPLSEKYKSDLDYDIIMWYEIFVIYGTVGTTLEKYKVSRVVSDTPLSFVLKRVRHTS